MPLPIARNSARFASACLAGALSIGLAACSTQDDSETSARPSLAVIPAPAQVKQSQGTFLVGAGTPVRFEGAEAEHVARFFADLVGRSRDLALPVAAAPVAGDEDNAIHLRLLAAEDGVGEEAYSLRVSPRRIDLSASHPRGLLYGTVTLWQLMTANSAQGMSVEVPAVEIDDAPRFAWRGFMLDVARHYMPPDSIKQLLEQMALHKLNTFHWHLTDDQGWRIEIKRYPKLTQIGAWRRPAGAAGTDAQGRPVRYGGFYTQEEVRDIVRYAAERFITVVPEIDMPGHAQAAIAAYPELGVDGARPGVSPDWGVHTYLLNVEDSTFEFVENVLAEVVDLFPGPYVHVGGDEAAKDRWEASARVQARMREVGARSPMELQSYFIRRLEKFLSSRGKRLVGWDEILEGGIAPNATVMSWRGAAGGIEAARHGHDVVMAPAPVMYLDHLQSDALDEPPGRPALVTLADVYAFEPVPAEIPAERAHHVLGAQMNAWTEHMRTPERVQHAAFPRLAALAEVTWSRADRRDFDDFLARLQPQLERYEAFGVRYARSALEPRATAKRLEGASPASRRDEELKTCSNKLALHLEDDAPAQGPRAVFLVDIIDPCWIYERAPLVGKQRIAVTVGQLPFNFQLWKDAKGVVVRPAATREGELTVRLDSCEGEAIATLSLAAALKNDELTRLEGSLASHPSTHDICLTFGTGSIDPLWVIDRVELL